MTIKNQTQQENVSDFSNFFFQQQTNPTQFFVLLVSNLWAAGDI